MAEWVKIPDYQQPIGTECMVCGKEINLGYSTNHLVPMICEECKEAIKYAKKLLKEKEKQKFFMDESGKITPLPVVVRCKDCVFGKREKNDSTGMTWIYCGHHRENRPEDWFCASGSRI